MGKKTHGRKRSVTFQWPHVDCLLSGKGIFLCLAINQNEAFCTLSRKCYSLVLFRFYSGYIKPSHNFMQGRLRDQPAQNLGRVIFFFSIFLQWHPKPFLLSGEAYHPLHKNDLVLNEKLPNSQNLWVSHRPLFAIYMWNARPHACNSQHAGDYRNHYADEVRGSKRTNCIHVNLILPSMQ